MGRIVDDHPSGLTYEEWDEGDGPEMPQERPEWASVVSTMSSEELNMHEDRVLADLDAADEEDLTIYDEAEMTPEETLELSEGALMRDKENRMIYVKVLDIWLPYSMARPIQPDRGLTKYGRMRKKYLEEWKVRTALALGEDFFIHCLEVQDRAKEMKRDLMQQLERNDPPPSKAEDPMAWVRHMEALDMQAEEIVTRTVVYS